MAAYARPVRFLLSRRWLGFAVVVVLLAWLALLLGQWQFHRLDDRRAENRVLATNLAADPVPVADALSTERQPTADQQWLPVEVSGTWDDEQTVVLKYQTRDGGPGVDVVTPLVTDSGVAVLVNRGWLATPNSGSETPDPPPATQGEVSITGYVRADATGAATTIADGGTRAVSSRAVAELTDYPLYQGFVDLASEEPAPAAALEPRPLPDDTSEGPHFFYGLQWWFFGALAVFGFLYLAYDETRGGAGREAARRRRELVASRRASRRQQRAEEAAQLVAWRYGERPDRPTDQAPERSPESPQEHPPERPVR